MSPAKGASPPLPKLVLVGRIGVGKSSLFARLKGESPRRRQKLAFIQSTRDWVQSVLPLAQGHVHLVDTARAVSGQHDDAIQVRAWQQTQKVIQQAWGIILITDATAGLLPQDKELAQQLRATGKLLIVVANKADSTALQQQALCGFSQLGLPVYPVSTHQGLGLKELLAWLQKQFSSSQATASENPISDATPQDAKPCFVVLGKPNAGKSTFLNTVLGQERYLTSATAGTTAQAVPALWQDQEGALYQLVDTAGLRRRSHVEPGWEKAAVSSATAALRHAQVALLLIDACAGVTQQDVKIASLIHRQRRGLVLVASKWDAACQQGLTESGFLQHVHRQLPFVSYAPLQFVSAWDRSSVLRVLQVAKEVHTSYHQRLGTAAVNRCLQKATQQHRPARTKNRLWKLYFGCQDAKAPPLFYIVCNRPKEVEPSYERYLMRCIRAEFGFEGVPLRLIFRARERTDMQTSGDST
ncbi:MAG: ribosome biogenesis GTPase Der [Myxococcota bacterium]